MHEDRTTRAARCCGCGRPVWPDTQAADLDAPAPPPELCDYCAVASPQ